MERTSNASDTIRRLLSGAGDLPVLPDAAVRILEEIRSPDVTPARLATFVKKDPVLATSVLRVANSALYGGKVEITDLAFAMTRIGLNQVRNLVMATVLRSKMADPQVYGKTGAALMDHSLGVAFGAQLLADTARLPADQAFLCGLLHDFGKLALIKALREEAGGEINDEGFALVEEHHPEAGALLAANWGLPEMVGLVARYHHALDEAPESARQMAALVSLADALAHKIGIGFPALDELDLAAHPSRRLLSVDEGALNEIIEDLPGLFGVARSAMTG